jgi:hypothetical protein
LFALDNPPLPEGSGNWVVMKAKRRKFIRKKSRKTASCREIVPSKNFILLDGALAGAAASRSKSGNRSAIQIPPKNV